MKGREKKVTAAPPEAAAATPFFARFLEGQTPEEDAEATVSERAPRAQYTTTRGGAKKPAAQKSAAKKSASKKSAGKKSAGTQRAAAKAVTLKYPSDKDEWVFYPYHVEAARIGPGSGPQTMKAPSDGDELPAFAVSYVDRKDAPPTTTTKAKAKEARVKITIPRKDILEAE
jgi:hypothetical protein